MAAMSGDLPPGVGLYAAARFPLTFSSRHSSGSRFSAAIVSQRHSSRTRFSSSLDAAIATQRFPAPSAGAILRGGGSASMGPPSGRTGSAVPSLLVAEVMPCFRERHRLVHIYSGLGRVFPSRVFNLTECLNAPGPLGSEQRGTSPFLLPFPNLKISSVGHPCLGFPPVSASASKRPSPGSAGGERPALGLRNPRLRLWAPISAIMSFRVRL